MAKVRTIFLTSDVLSQNPTIPQLTAVVRNLTGVDDIVANSVQPVALGGLVICGSESFDDSLDLLVWIPAVAEPTVVDSEASE